MQALSDLLLNSFKWHLLSNEAASLTVLNGIYRQMRQCYAYYITVLSAVWTEEYLECSSGQLLKRYLESLRSVMRARSLDLRDQRIRRPWTCGNPVMWGGSEIPADHRIRTWSCGNPFMWAGSERGEKKKKKQFEEAWTSGNPFAQLKLSPHQFFVLLIYWCTDCIYLFVLCCCKLIVLNCCWHFVCCSAELLTFHHPFPWGINWDKSLVSVFFICTIETVSTSILCGFDVVHALSILIIHS